MVLNSQPIALLLTAITSTLSQIPTLGFHLQSHCPQQLCCAVTWSSHRSDQFLALFSDLGLSMNCLTGNFVSMNLAIQAV